jgi:N-acetylglucosamine malate deacetylase 2
MNESIHALIIIAHPDDESFLFAGTTLKFQEEGKTVAVICATRGEKGADRLNRDLTPLQMAKIRTAELLGACNILHCECKKFFNHPDGALDKDNFDQLVTELTEEINSYQPKIILTFGSEGISGHRDHITIGRAAIAASKQAHPQPAEIWLASIPASKAVDFNHHMNQRKIHHLHFIKDHLRGVSDEKLTRIDVSKYKDTKIEALKAHQSQYVPHLTWPDFLEEECFEIIKL